MKIFTDKILKKLNLDGSVQLKKPIRGLKGYTLFQLIEALISTNSVVEAGKYLGYTDNPLKQSIRQYLLPVLIRQKAIHWSTTLLAEISHRQCTICKRILEYNSFYKDISNSLGISYDCKSCKIAKTKLQKEYILERVVPWSDKSAIRQYYNNCPEGMVVDHVRPLRGALVSGLHVLSNLQYLDKSANMVKGNKFEIADFV